MAENYKHLYEQMKKMVAMYQDEIVPDLRKHLEKCVEVVRCKYCKHQRRVWINDRRRKEKGYWIFSCDQEEYGLLGADDDFCSYGERKDNGKE